MSEPAAATVVEPTKVGSYFVATYPTFSVWSQEAVDDQRYFTRPYVGSGDLP